MAISNWLMMLPQMVLAIFNGPLKIAQPLLALNMLLRSDRRDIENVTLGDLTICFVVGDNQKLNKSGIHKHRDFPLPEQPPLKISESVVDVARI